MSSIQLDWQIACANPQGLPKQAEFQRWVTPAVQQHYTAAEITIRLVDAEESQQLNQHYRALAYPTNVLAFPNQALITLNPPLLGDLVICRQVVENEAHEQQKPLLAHWAHMVIHGTLHLLGYQHDNESTAQEMESLEIQILQALGYANPYVTTV
ncbi:MAG: rRNA maturation RNase YbeY [Candidatus Symbiodolus clandestinus]